MLENSLIATTYFFKGQKGFYRGKVRDVYDINHTYLAVVACDRISAFDHVMPRAIPYKGQVLNQIAAHFLDKTADLVPNWKIATPDANVTVGWRCEPIRVEMVIRGYLAGHAWRTYKDGGRELCGNRLPEGLKENDKLPEPIITPTIKASKGHDTDISASEIVAQKILKKKEYEKLEHFTRLLYQRGSEVANENGLILVDTKYEFGIKDNEFLLIDEVHTPDSSRYFYLDEYDKAQATGSTQKQLSKEFVRQWLIANNFQGLEGQVIPEMTDEFVDSVTDRYLELFEKVTGKKFEKASYQGVQERIETNIAQFLETLS